MFFEWIYHIQDSQFLISYFLMILVDGHCPIDCKYNEWNEWSSCTVTCGGGIKIRSRTIKTHPLYGGKECEGENSLDDVQTSTEKTECNTQLCPPGNYINIHSFGGLLNLSETIVELKTQ